MMLRACRTHPQEREESQCGHRTRVDHFFIILLRAAARGVVHLTRDPVSLSVRALTGCIWDPIKAARRFGEI